MGEATRRNNLTPFPNQHHAPQPQQIQVDLKDATPKKESKMALNPAQVSPIIEIPPVQPVPDPIVAPDPPVTDLPSKNLLRVSEAAEYFGVHERTIRLWIEHGHLQAEKPVGTVFISRESIKNFRLMGRRVVED